MYSNPTFSADPTSRQGHYVKQTRATAVPSRVNLKAASYSSASDSPTNQLALPVSTHS